MKYWVTKVTLGSERVNLGIKCPFFVYYSAWMANVRFKLMKSIFYLHGSIRGVVGTGSQRSSELHKSPSQQQNKKLLGLISPFLSLHCF